MRHVSILRNDLESLNGLSVSYYIIEEHWSIFLNPGRTSVIGLVLIEMEYSPRKFIVRGSACVCCQMLLRCCCRRFTHVDVLGDSHCGDFFCKSKLLGFVAIAFSFTSDAMLLGTRKLVRVT